MILRGKRIAIIAPVEHKMLLKSALVNAQFTLKQLGVFWTDVAIVWVSDKLPISETAQTYAASGRYDGVICFGQRPAGTQGDDPNDQAVPILCGWMPEMRSNLFNFQVRMLEAQGAGLAERVAYLCSRRHAHLQAS